MTTADTRLEDIIGLNYTKLGFFRELQIKIQQLKASNRMLDQKHQEIKAILDGITDVMAVVSPDFRILSFNHVFEEVFKHVDPLNMPCYKAFRGRSKPCKLCPLATARDTNRVCRQQVIVPLEGQNRQFEITAAPIRDSKGKLISILILKRDVTLEKEYQAKYYHAEKMATIGLLSAGVAHEINNPLTAISGFAEGIKRRLPRLDDCLDTIEDGRELRDDLHEYIETILTECNRCRDIVKNLLTFSPRKKVEFSIVDLNGLAADVLKLLHHQLKRLPPGSVCMDLEEDLPNVKGVAAELKQVVLNLILNAIDAIQNGGHIIIASRTLNENRISLTITDTGCGIPPENIGKLFDPFFTTKPVGKGIGIGLSTCYNIIRQHDGEIHLSSEEGKGATFNVQLPAFQT